MGALVAGLLLGAGAVVLYARARGGGLAAQAFQAKEALAQSLAELDKPPPTPVTRTGGLTKLPPPGA